MIVSILGLLGHKVCCNCYSALGKAATDNASANTCASTNSSNTLWTIGNVKFWISCDFHMSWYILLLNPFLGFPGGTRGKEPACQCRKCKRHRFDFWVRKIPWRRAWQGLPVVLPGESHGQRSLVGYNPWGCKESDTTERLHFTFFLLHTGLSPHLWRVRP